MGYGPISTALNQGSVVIGDYIYLDGGIVTFPGNNATLLGETLSIFLGSSWTNSTVNIQSTPKDEYTPILNQPFLWPSADGSSFFSWGGSRSGFIDPGDPPDLAVRKFTLDGNGGGEWSNSSIPNGVTRPAGGLAAATNDTLYVLSGFASGSTSPETKNLTYWIPLPGLVSFNSTISRWANDTSLGDSPSGRTFWGHMEYLPAYSSHGVLVAFGGRMFGSGTYPISYNSYRSFVDVTIYDIASQKWYTQSVTGQYPGPRDRFCAAGIQSSNGTYEIFVYGGNYDKETYSDVYVLTIPGFTWFKLSSISAPRMLHSCAVIGKRQMFSFGGTTDESQSRNSYKDLDSLTNGIGIFDMTDTEWKTEYRADTDEYHSPAVVSDWYAKGRLSDVAWSKEDIKNFFVAEKDTSSSKTPVIVGATVGPIILLLVIGLAAFFAWNRRKHHKALLPKEKTDIITGSPQSQGGDQFDVRPPDNKIPLELDNSGTGIYELDPVGCEVPSELGNPRDRVLELPAS